MIDEQRASNTGGGDHFAKPGANDRIWNALEKLCLEGSGGLRGLLRQRDHRLVSEAWLGSAYQITSQLNVVNPAAPRNRPTGTTISASRRRKSSSAIRPCAPAVARPHPPGRRRTLRHAGRDRADPLPALLSNLCAGLSRDGPARVSGLLRPAPCAASARQGGRGLFNPAVFHAAGTNRSKDVRRIANLLQVSSAYGRAMESVDRTRMSAALYPALRSMLASGRLTPQQGANAVAACAEGYSFPTNLDRDPPIGGLAPKTQQALLHEALQEGWAPEAAAALNEQHARRLT